MKSFNGTIDAKIAQEDILKRMSSRGSLPDEEFENSSDRGGDKKDKIQT